MNGIDRKRLLYTEFRDFEPNTPTIDLPNGPVCGNGDIGVVMDRTDQGLRLWLSKNDFWCYRSYHMGGGVRSVAFLDIKLDDMKKAETAWWQDAVSGHIGMRYKDWSGTAEIKASVPRGGSVVIEIGEPLGGGAAEQEIAPDPLAVFFLAVGHNGAEIFRRIADEPGIARDLGEPDEWPEGLKRFLSDVGV